MPTLSRFFIRAGLLYLAAALALGVLMALPSSPSIGLTAAAAPMTVHLLTVGWVTQMIFGVAFWMFPRTASGRTGEATPTAWLAFVALNAGLVLRAVSEPLIGTNPNPLAGGWVVAVSALLQFAAVASFAVILWRRAVSR